MLFLIVDEILHRAFVRTIFQIYVAFAHAFRSIMREHIGEYLRTRGAIVTTLGDRIPRKIPPVSLTLSAHMATLMS